MPNPPFVPTRTQLASFLGNNARLISAFEALFQKNIALAPTYTEGQLLAVDSAGDIVGIDDVVTGNVLLSGGVGNLPTYGKVGLTTHVTGTLPVANGGTGLTAGTSGGVLAFTGSTTLVSSGVLALNALMLGGGAGGVPSTPVGLGTSTTVLHGNAAGPPTWGAVSLTADVSGLLPLANGGTNANLTASNGGVFYSTATAGAILAGTATAGQVLRSGAVSAPSWSTATYPDTVTVNQVLYGASSNVVGGDADFTFDGTLVTLTQSGLGVTPADSCLLQNATAAAAGSPQISPALRWRGFAWNTGTGTSQPLDVRAYLITSSGANIKAGSRIRFDSSLNGAAYTQMWELYADGGVVFSGALVSGSSVTAAAGNQIGWAGRTNLWSQADGRLLITNQANNDFGRITIGGTTSAYPAIKRQGAGLEIRLADDSGYSFLTGRLTPPAGSTTAGTAPLKFTSGTLLGTAEAGVIEFDSDKFYASITTGPARKEITLSDAALTSGTMPVATTNGRLTDSGVTYGSSTLTTPKLTASSGEINVGANSGSPFINILGGATGQPYVSWQQNGIQKAYAQWSNAGAYLDIGGGAVAITSLAGSGTRQVFADANGVLSAP
jgi:hypothetical protein